MRLVLPLCSLLALLAAPAQAQHDLLDHYPTTLTGDFVGLLTVHAPDSLVGTSTAGTCFRPRHCPLPPGGAWGPRRLVRARDPGYPDSEYPVDADEGCARYTNADEVRGRFALVRRSLDCSAVDQALSAMGAGAVGLLLYNDERVPDGDAAALWNVDWDVGLIVGLVMQTTTRARGLALESALAEAEAVGDSVMVTLGYTHPTDTEAGPRGAGIDLTAWPNPVRERATVRYAVERPGPVRLAVYDALGREAAVLVDGERAEGEHLAALDAQGWAPGLYVARLTGRDHAEAVRFTVVR